jgi:hypothetical protein
MDERREGRVRLVTPPKGTKAERPAFGSRMPQTSGRRQEIKATMRAFLLKSNGFRNQTREDVREGEDKNAVLISLAFEIYIRDKMELCLNAIEDSIDAKVLGDFIEVANIATNYAANYQNIIYTPEIARSTFEELAAFLHTLCSDLGIDTIEPSAVEAAYMEKARELLECDDQLK